MFSHQIDRFFVRSRRLRFSGCPNPRDSFAILAAASSYLKVHRGARILRQFAQHSPWALYAGYHFEDAHG